MLKEKFYNSNHLLLNVHVMLPSVWIGFFFKINQVYNFLFCITVFTLPKERLWRRHAPGSGGIHPGDSSRRGENKIRLQCVQNFSWPPTDGTQTTQTPRHLRCPRRNSSKACSTSHVRWQQLKISILQKIFHSPQSRE